ncbi:MAG TPA: phytanoyl-CoA dioxygenase family protein [Steroidobacteraceae bacterium]|nr:phytanoyl-CoA dioxygenase family protein [Steroidobacteraceae bacterium]
MEQPLTSQQVDEFFRQGFLVIETPQIPAAELDWCRDILMRMILGGERRTEGRNINLTETDGGGDMTSPSVLQPSMYARELRKLSYRNIALATARQLLGADAEFAGDHAIFKPSHRGHPTPWHQDEAFREPGFDYNELSIWIAITPSTFDNGAMAYIPGSHRLGVLPHRLHGSAKQANTIECYEGFDPQTAAVRPIPAGAMIIHHGRTVHGASGNQSASSRLAYILQYSTPVKMSKHIRNSPWLVHLRSANQQQRKNYLMRGGIFPELLRILRSDRHSHRHFLSFFWRRRINQVRSLFKHQH